MNAIASVATRSSMCSAGWLATFSPAGPAEILRIELGEHAERVGEFAADAYGFGVGAG